MFGSPETLVAQNNYKFEDLVAISKRRQPKWDIVDHQYWALSKKQYHGAYSSEMFAVMSGSMRTGDSLSKIAAPMWFLGVLLFVIAVGRAAFAHDKGAAAEAAAA